MNRDDLHAYKNLDFTESIPKSNAETEITANKKVLKKNSSANGNNQTTENKNLNNSKMSDLEKSSLMRTQSALDREIVNKALKYNKASDKENSFLGKVLS